MKVLIIGCGYLGSALARVWIQAGTDVTGWVRSESSVREIESQGIVSFIGDVADPACWLKLPSAFDLVVHCASSGRGGAEAYRSVYREGLRQVLRHLPRTRLLFVSSTSVYGQKDGSMVDERSPAVPSSETSSILRDAEELGLGGGAIIARAAGLYGPGRGVLFRKFWEGQAVLEGDRQRWMNQIHRDDLVSALLTLAHSGQPGEIYNVSDGNPCTYEEFYQWLSDRLHRPMPPDGAINPNRKRGLTNKRVLNDKLRSLDWRPAYPSFREGLTVEIERFK